MKESKLPLDCYGFREGSLRSKAASLYAKGATREEVKAQIGVTHLVVLAELEAKGYTIIKKKIKVGKGRRQYRYTIGGKYEKTEKV